jgi:pyruvate/2-oxoglutarate dehydrogenase complex dihydrolipoamide dehydrogenase (E3) component
MTLPPSPLVLSPDDRHNRTLVERVHPPSWRNPAPAGRYHLVVIGAGTAGLVAAVGAAGLGARVAIVERHLMGGDCLNYGCVPSKALVRAARAAADIRAAHHLGLRIGSVDVDFEAVMTRMRLLRAELAAKDSAARLTSLGIDVFLGHARFVARDTVDVEGRRLRFARAVIATGSRVVPPPIPGLTENSYLTHETVFSLTTLPSSFIIIGAGSVGCELAQAFRRFGSQVTLVETESWVLPREDADASRVVEESFAHEGIRLVHGAQVARVEHESGSSDRRVVVRGTQEDVLRAEALLVTGGQAPNVEGLDLDRADVRWDERGVVVDDRLRTTNPRVWAAGDVASPFKFTHAADAMARIVVRNSLFLGRKQMSALTIPRATYTDPEVAHVGLTAAEAARRSDVRTFTEPLEHVDRAVIDATPKGFARIHVDSRGRILGATAVAAHAGELIGEMSLAISARVSVDALLQTVHAYPTESEVWRKLADQWNRARLTPPVRSLLERVLRWR